MQTIDQKKPKTIKIAKQVSVLALSTVSYLFFNQTAVNAGEEIITFGNLREISKLEFKTEYTTDCNPGNSLSYYNREVLSYLQNNGVPVIADTTQESYPSLILYIDCIGGRDIVPYQNGLNLFKIINENGKMIEVKIYDLLHYGVSDLYSFKSMQKKSVVKLINEFIKSWKSYH